MAADVLIVGLGPVGQLLALMLQQHGVSVLAIDRAPEPYPLPRAASIDAARGMARRGFDAFEIDHAGRMAAYFAGGGDGIATDHVLQLTGHDPRPFEALLTPATAPEA